MPQWEVQANVIGSIATVVEAETATEAIEKAMAEFKMDIDIESINNIDAYKIEDGL